MAMTHMQITKNHKKWGLNKISNTIIFAPVLVCLVCFSVIIFIYAGKIKNPELLVSEEINYVNFSQTSQKVVYFLEKENSFFVTDLNTKEEKKLELDFELKQTTHHIFSPNFNYIAMVDEDMNLSVYSINDKEKTFLGSNPTSIDWSKDENKLGYSLIKNPDQETSQESIFIFDTKTKNKTLIREVVTQGDEFLSLIFSDKPNHIIYSSDEGGLGYNYFEVNLETFEENDYLDGENFYSLEFSPTFKHLIYLPFTFDLQNNYIIKNFETSFKKEIPFEFEGFDCAWDTNEKNMFCLDYTKPDSKHLVIKKYNIESAEETVVGYLNNKKYTTSGVMMNNDNQLFFVNLEDNKLYFVNL